MKYLIVILFCSNAFAVPFIFPDLGIEDSRPNKKICDKEIVPSPGCALRWFELERQVLEACRNREIVTWPLDVKIPYLDQHNERIVDCDEMFRRYSK